MLEDFNIDQQLMFKGKSLKGINRITEHGNTWRIKNKFVKGHFPWVKEDSILLESLKDRTWCRWFRLLSDEDFELI